MLNADAQNPDSAGCTPLMYAISARQDARVLALVGHVDLDAADRDGKTALHHATLMGQAQTVKTLLRAKANPNLRDKDGATALIYAAMCGYEDVVRVLLRHDADARCMDLHGRTALEAARRSGFAQVRSILERLLDR